MKPVCWKQNSLALAYNFMTDALAPKVTIASAGMVLAVYDWQHVLLFQS